MLSPASSTSRASAIHLRPDDNLAVAARPLRKGEAIRVAGRELEVLDSVPLGHKVAVEDIREGEAIR
ncbi:MAG TPA: altronate dehydratase, partial [Planctomycetota bacterium]|nr:altronate dehydratase [Planctomycetota bacterium]